MKSPSSTPWSIGLLFIVLFAGPAACAAENGLPFPLIDRFENFHMKEGMPTHKVHCVLRASDGKLWLGTYNGALVREDGAFHRIGTEDGLAKYPYIRESRRIRAEFTILEQHVSTDYRLKETGARRDEVQAARFPDSVGIGSYRIDLHPSTGGVNYIDISSLPFQIPLGALIPRRIENLLPACKNLGVTHISNGCYRLHPVEWNIGEAVGALAAFCLEKKIAPRAVLKTSERLKNFQSRLAAQGVPLDWPKITPR